MDILKRALSLPMLFKDWDDPFLGFKQRRRKLNISTKVDREGPGSLYKSTDNVTRKNSKRSSKRFQTWNRLIESRSTSRIPTLVEVKEDKNENIQASQPQLSSPCVSSRIAVNNGHSSSSCDLAPALLSIYDSYASSNKLANKNGIVKKKVNGNIEETTTTTGSASTKCLSQSCHNVHWSGNSSNSRSKNKQQKSQSVEILNGNNMDEDVHMKDVSGEEGDNSQCGDNIAGRCNGNAVNISVSVIPCDDSHMHNHVANHRLNLHQSHHHNSVLNQDVGNVVGQNSSHAALTASCINTHIPLSESDAKKRPLSVSSTSSSVSSSSSLPRHQRKKIATMATSGMASSLTIDQFCDLCKVHGECPHKLQRFDMLQSGQCSCAQSSKDGQLRHICRVHGPAVDINLAKTLCPNCNHSRTGLLTDHSHICDISEVSELTNSETSESDINVTANSSAKSSSLQGPDLNRSISDPCGTGHARSPSNASHSHKFMYDLVGSYMGRVVQEIIDTENVYVSDLRDINQGYIGYLNNSPDIHFDSEEKEVLFGNIQEIYEFNSEFLENLELCELDPVEVAQCFVDRTDCFLIYADYCTNYPSSMEVLARVMQDENLSEVFKHQQMYLNHALPLGSYLLKPVQRILKYHLFLENMLNNFDKCKAGYDVISLAFQSMTDMAQHINEMKRQHERAVHIQEIQSTLFGWDGDDLTTYGKLILEDTFRMHGAKAYRRIYLFEKGMIIAKRKEDGNLLVKCTIKCSDLMLVESIPKEPLSFHVIPFNNPRMQNTLQGRNLDHKHKWCQEIKRLMIENYQAVIPDKAKKLMMMLGKSKEEEDFDESSIEDQSPTKKQHTAPEYLERRRQRRRSTSIIPDFGLLKSRRGRRQSEEPSTPTTSPSGMVHNKSEPSGFVSYLMRKPSAEDVQEEDEDIEELSECASSTRGSSKSSTLDSQVVSLDGFTDSQQQTPSADKNSVKLSFVDIDIEESCGGPKRISRIDSDDAILQDASDNVNQNDNNVESPVISKDLCLEKKKTPTSPLLRSGSYRKAYEFNRTDSVKISDKTSKRVLNAMRNKNAKTTESQNNNVRNMNVEDLDDGYVGVVFSNNGVTVPVIGESSTDSEPKNYIILPHFGESSTDSDYETISGAHIVPNSHAKSDNSFVDTKAKKSVVKTKGAISKNCSNNQNVKSAGAIVLQNSLNDSVTDNEHGQKDVRSRIYMDSSPSPNNGNWKNVDFPAVYHKTSTPVSCASSTQYSQCGPVDTSKTTAIGSVYSVNNLGSPVRMTSDLKNGLSQSKLDCSDKMDTTDPWVPRSKAESPCSRFRDRIKKPVFRQYSMNAMDASKKINTKKRISKLFRSNSCTSLDEGKNSDRNNAKHTSHRRRFSDTSTLLFANKTAFLATECPHTIKHSPEVQRTLARYGTPPREMGPDYLLEEINECKEKGKTVMRYATPPRELMDPTFKTDGDTIENKYTCALESEILESLRKEMQDSAIMDSHNPAKNNSSHSPQVTKATNNANSKQSNDDLESENSCSNKEMWTELQQYIESSPNSSGPRFPLLAHDMALSPVTRPGNISTAMSQSVLNTHTAHNDNTVPKSQSDGIVDSLRSAVMSLTSKITRRSPRSVDASPVRVMTRRARSLGAEEDARIKPVSSNMVLKSTEAKPQKKDKRSKFVFHLARTYSDKLKRNKVDQNSSSIALNKMPSNSLGHQTSVLSKETVSKADVTTIGERMADARPKVLGTYTLQRHRPRKSKAKKDSESNKKKNVEPESDSLESNTPESMDTNEEFTMQELVNNIFVPSSAMCGNLDISGSEMNEDPVSMESFYEQQCNDALECQLENETYRDSAVYSDDGGINSLDSDFAAPNNVVVKETKQKLERNNSFREVKKIEVKKAEKGQGIKNILKSLEAAQSKSPVKSDEPSSPPIKSIVVPIANEDIHKVKMSPSLKRNRCRELLQVAMLTRIRQNSFDGLENDDEDDPITCACDCNGECSKTASSSEMLGNGGDGCDDDDNGQPKKGKK